MLLISLQWNHKWTCHMMLVKLLQLHHQCLRCSCLQNPGNHIAHVCMMMTPTWSRMPRRPKQNNRRSSAWIRSCSSTSPWFEWWQLAQTSLQPWMTIQQSWTWKMTSLRMNCGLMRIKWTSQMSQMLFGLMSHWTNLQQHHLTGLTSWLMRWRSTGCFPWAFCKGRQSQTWSKWERWQRVSSTTGARRCTRVELRNGWEGVASWLENLQVKSAMIHMPQRQGAIPPIWPLWSTSRCWEMSLMSHATAAHTRPHLLHWTSRMPSCRCHKTGSLGSNFMVPSTWSCATFQVSAWVQKLGTGISGITFLRFWNAAGVLNSLASGNA